MGVANAIEGSDGLVQSPKGCACWVEKSGSLSGYIDKYICPELYDDD